MRTETGRSVTAPRGINPTSAEAENWRLAIATAEAAGRKAGAATEADVASIAKALLTTWHAAATQDRGTALTVLDHILELTAPSHPDLAPFCAGLADACDEWAEWASEAHVAQMLMACIRRMPGRAPIKARKKLMVELWNSLGPDDRAAFSRHIGTDAGGKR